MYYRLFTILHSELIIMSTFASLMMPPYCDTMVYSKNGEVDVESTILNCSTHATSPTIMPNYQGLYPINITAQIVVNNLVNINQLTQTVALDFKFRLTWFDNRLNITDDLFKAVNPVYASNGIDITFLRNQGSLQLWLPDM